MPKFFEVRQREVVRMFQVEVDCAADYNLGEQWTVGNFSPDFATFLTSSSLTLMDKNNDSDSRSLANGDLIDPSGPLALANGTKDLPEECLNLR